MNPMSFDRISKLFAELRLSRRQALTAGGAGVATAAFAAAGLRTTDLPNGDATHRPEHDEEIDADSVFAKLKSLNPETNTEDD